MNVLRWKLSKVRNLAISMLAPTGPIPPYPQSSGVNFEVVSFDDMCIKGVH